MAMIKCKKCKTLFDTDMPRDTCNDCAGKEIKSALGPMIDRLGKNWPGIDLGKAVDDAIEQVIPRKKK